MSTQYFLSVLLTGSHFAFYFCQNHGFLYYSKNRLLLPSTGDQGGRGGITDVRCTYYIGLTKHMVNTQKNSLVSPEYPFVKDDRGMRERNLPNTQKWRCRLHLTWQQSQGSATPNMVQWGGLAPGSPPRWSRIALSQVSWLAIDIGVD